MFIDNTTYFDLEIGEYNNFLHYADLLHFQMVCTAGIALPYFNIMFRTNDVKIKNKIIENNVVKIKIGQTPSDADTFRIAIAEKSAKPDTDGNYYLINFMGFLNDKRFLIDRKIECYTGTSLEVLTELCADYLGTELDTTIGNVNDTSSKWIRSNETVQIFMADVWLHMNIAPSVPLMAINKDGKVLLESLDILKSMSPKWNFTPNNPTQSNEIKYLNKFKPKSYKFSSNLYAGYGRVISIPTTETGNYDVVINDNDPELSATQSSETTNSGITAFEGFYNNENVHSQYHQSYFYNTAKLVKMSSIIGKIDVLGYYKNLKLLDVVSVVTDKVDSSVSGKYIVDTITVNFQYNSPLKTEVYVTRDNLNDLENHITDKSKTMKVTNSQKQELLTSVRNLRRMVALGRLGIDGTLLKRVTAYSTDLKYNTLTSFSVNGQSLNLSSQLEALNSLKYVGNSILNNFIDMFIPAPYNMVLHDFAIRNYSLLSYFSQLVTQFVPSEVQDVLIGLVSAVAYNTNLLVYIGAANAESLAEDTVSKTLSDSTNSVISYTDSVEGVTDVTINIGSDMRSNEDIIRVDNIISEFEENISGADIPMAVPDLTESELLMPTLDLKDLIADNIVSDLTNRGYLDGIDNFKDILKGNNTLDFNTINAINANVGTSMYVRHWGAFNSEIELTDYFLRKSYKDKYKTVSTTKIINAKGGKRIFIALPTFETGLNFYINSTKVIMNTMDISLGYINSSKNNIPYTVYFTDSETTYNSNNTTVEIRKSA